MTKDQKSRLKKLVLTVTSVLLAGIFYYLFVKLSGLAMPCLIHKFTGIYCAGCGITRMFLALFELDFALAAKNNILALALLVPIIVFSVNRGIKYVLLGRVKFSKSEKVCVIAFIVLLVAFTVIRNLDSFSFLRPI